MRTWRVSFQSLPVDLWRGRDVRAPVFLPAAFVMIRADGLFLAVADDGQLVLRDPHAHQKSFGRMGALVAESQVVFGGAALIGAAFHNQLLVRIVLENALDYIHVAAQRCGGV